MLEGDLELAVDVDEEGQPLLLDVSCVDGEAREHVPDGVGGALVCLMDLFDYLATDYALYFVELVDLVDLLARLNLQNVVACDLLTCLDDIGGGTLEADNDDVELMDLLDAGVDERDVLPVYHRCQSICDTIIDYLEVVVEEELLVWLQALV